MVKGNRRGRSDKKVDVKPTISEELKTKIYQMSEYYKIPVKTIGEFLCLEGLKVSTIVEKLQPFLIRDYRLQHSVLFGNETNSKIKVDRSGYQGKITIKFNRRDYNKICELAYALDITPTTACTVLLNIVTQDVQLTYSIIKRVPQ